MSASLVGSEMCIRDRHCALRRCVPNPEVPQHEPGIPSSEAPHRALNPEALCAESGGNGAESGGSA
eukprot:2537471-Alexandrium_andersonii.AAC.1